ncbi:hypothetical protein E4U41_005425 [Claviceps citrina]|nr:hypothetical protein E4U41_005425 [Claviceps citrina]
MDHGETQLVGRAGASLNSLQPSPGEKQHHPKTHELDHSGVERRPQCLLTPERNADERMESESDSDVELGPWDSEAKLLPTPTLQAVFALIFSNGSAYLTSLGVSGPALSFIWSVGPICGLVLQPCFGLLSDRCQSSWGRRKPLIFFGALGATASLLSLASAEPLGNGITRMLMPPRRPYMVERNVLPATLAVFCVMTLNVSVQALQCGLRTLIVDTVPPPQQQTANAWAGILVSLTNVLCYGLSFADLREEVGFLRDSSQFAILCVITSVLLTATVSVTCLTVREERGHDHAPELLIRGNGPRGSIRAMVLDLYGSFFRLTPRVRTALKAHYLGNLDKQSHSSQSAYGSTRGADRQYTASPTGSLGLLIFSLVAVVAGILIPRVTAYRASWTSGSKRNAAEEQALRQTWAASQILFATAMLLTILVSSPWQAHVLMGLSGISWAVSIWAPHAIIGAHISASGRVGGAAPKCEVRPGIVVGLHNAAVSAPQIVSAACCGLLFWMLDGVSEDVIGWALRVAALSTLAAAWLIGQLDG